jgi:tetratricopeptide (TPR) repeat protein
MSIESLKQQARRHEQDEQWQKALEHYLKAIKELEKEEQADIGLINRVGDLFVRVGKLDQAVQHYDKAVDLYREAFLPNNAIAVCKKIIRNVPSRHAVYLKIGQIRAEQGFLSDARTNFLTYAERMQREGNLDESFRALVEFCDLAPDDVDVRITVADQMAANQRNGDAVAQLLIAYGRLKQAGETERAEGVEKTILALDPDADLTAAVAASASDGIGSELEFGEIEIGGSDQGAFEDAAELRAAAEHFVADAEKGFGVAEEEQVLAFTSSGSGEDEEESDFDLPVMSFGSDSEEDEAFQEEGPELPVMSFGEEEDGSEPAAVGEDEPAELPTFEVGAVSEEATADEDEMPMELPTLDLGDPEPEGEEVPSLDMSEPAAALEEAHEEVAAEAAKASLAPPEKETVAEPAGGYVDLGAMILGGASGREKTTRFKVAYQEPSGNEEADFANMLSQFKEKVAENIDVGDVRAHHDLGTAYKEMGLLQEAVSAFQAALRASPEHLPTYELMGQTFLEMGQPEAAVRTLQRALKIHSGVEDEFVGIYYYLAQAYEVLDKKESAVEYYDRVFSLDINFADVTERLRELR